MNLNDIFYYQFLDGSISVEDFLTLQLARSTDTKANDVISLIKENQIICDVSKLSNDNEIELFDKVWLSKKNNSASHVEYSIAICDRKLFVIKLK